LRWQQEDYFIATDTALLDFPVILRFISEDSYWGKGRTAETMRRAIDNSTLCFGLYHETEAGPVLAGFARVISDLTIFAYLSDVFVLPEHRGKGLGKWLIQTICDHPDLRDLKNICLITRTPEFYESLSFAVLEAADVRKFMMKVATQAPRQVEEL
jgi:GNAT superfamily N-acetyltransferase